MKIFLSFKSIFYQYYFPKILTGLLFWSSKFLLLLFSNCRPNGYCFKIKYKFFYFEYLIYYYGY